MEPTSPPDGSPLAADHLPDQDNRDRRSLTPRLPRTPHCFSRQIDAGYSADSTEPILSLPPPKLSSSFKSNRGFIFFDSFGLISGVSALAVAETQLIDPAASLDCTIIFTVHYLR